MICKTCNQDKKELDFYISSKSKCKKCFIIYTKEHRDLDKYHEYYRNWYAKNGRKRKPHDRLHNIRWQNENMEKILAQRKVRWAIKKGELTRPQNCSNCNRTTKVQGHHTDYSKVLEVIWLCGSCHKKVHMNLTQV